MTLTNEERQHFVNHGYVRLDGCFTEREANEVTRNVWTRLGMSPTNKLTWDRMRSNMPGIRTFDSSVIAPKAWSAIVDLCGGEDRVHPRSKDWRDSLIVNLGSSDQEGIDVKPWELNEWHVDGDFFVHYLDSPEQALLVMPLWTDVEERGGGTWICPLATTAVAQHLYRHPGGVSPSMAPRSTPEFTSGEPFRENKGQLSWFNGLARRIGRKYGMAGFVELTGKLGDVFLLHPLMLHTSSHNPKRKVRIITNPPVSLRQPFNLQCSSGSIEFSLVEQATLKALGYENGLDGWKITAERERIVPKRVILQEKMKRTEQKRIHDAKQ